MSKILLAFLIGAILLGAIVLRHAQELNAPEVSATRVEVRSDPARSDGIGARLDLLESEASAESNTLNETTRSGADSESGPVVPNGGETAIVRRVGQSPLGQSLETRAAAVRKQIETELVDEDWAPYAEAAFVNYVTQRPEIMQHGFPEIKCRSTSCEVRLTATGANHVDTGAWAKVLTDGFMDFPWREHWVLLGIANEEELNGISRVTWYLMRGPLVDQPQPLIFVSSPPPGIFD